MHKSDVNTKFLMHKSDVNTKFFHTSVKEKFSRNKIIAFQTNSGEIIEKWSEVGNHYVITSIKNFKDRRLGAECSTWDRRLA